MTRKLEEILNLPNVKEAFAQVDKKEKAKDDFARYQKLKDSADKFKVYDEPTV